MPTDPISTFGILGSYNDFNLEGEDRPIPAIGYLIFPRIGYLSNAAGSLL